MVDVRSKNLYELLGNDPELDPNRPPPPPARAVDRPIPRHGKREAPKEAPEAPKEAPVSQPRETNNRRGGRATGGNEAAFRDRTAGRNNNRSKPTDEAEQPLRPGRVSRGRGDRQSRTGQTDTRKQIEQAWGAGSGEKAWDDERQGENIAKEEETGGPQTPAEEAEEADKSKSYSDYLAEKAARDSLAAKPVRAPNEGTKEDQKWANAKELKHGEEEDSYIKGTSEKTKREKQRKEKTYLDVDLRFVEQPRSSPSSGPRGGRGGGRARGDRTRGIPRSGAPRGGAPRGGAPRGDAPRGGRGGPRAPAGPTVDEKNFPSLGGN